MMTPTCTDMADPPILYCMFSVSIQNGACQSKGEHFHDIKLLSFVFCPFLSKKRQPHSGLVGQNAVVAAGAATGVRRFAPERPPADEPRRAQSDGSVITRCGTGSAAPRARTGST